jgi:hypothetical protein
MAFEVQSSPLLDMTSKLNVIPAQAGIQGQYRDVSASDLGFPPARE